MKDELPEGWSQATLESLTSAIQYGYTASAEAASVGPRMLRITDIQEGRVNWATVPGCTIDQSALKKYRLAPGDIVFARSGATTGKSFLIRSCPEDAVFASYLIRVRALDSVVLPQFLSQFFATPDYWAYITDNLAGNAQPNCNGSKLSALPVPIAPLPEQHRIVEKVEALLDQVNRAKQRLDRVPLILKRFRHAVLAAACSGELTSESDADEWEELTIERVALVGTGSTPLRTNPAFYSRSGTPWITSAATARPFVTQAEEFVTDHAVRAHRLKKYPIGTLLVAMYGEGKTRGQISELAIEATINQAMAAIVVDSQRANKEFVKLHLQGNYLQMRSISEGGNQPNLNLSKIKEFPLRIPSPRTQKRIVERVDALMALADTIERRVQAAAARANKLPQAILAKAFSGELVPTEAELARLEGRTYETAEELLKRVTALGSDAPAAAKGRGRRGRKVE